MRGTQPIGSFHGRKWPTSDWSLEESKKVVGRGKPDFTKTGGDTISPPVIFHSLIGEAGFSALGLTWVPSLACSAI